MFNHIGARDPNRTIPRLAELTRPLWQGERYEGYHLYDGKIPIIATGLRNLREHGPAGEVFQRFGRDHWQPRREAIGNPRREAADTRRRAEYAAREHQEQLRRADEQQKAEREARRPVCADCGTKFTDDRWEETETAGWGALGDSHAHLCDDCAQRAITDERRAWQDASEHQDQDRARPEG
ncbi:hypothetical protein [Streptomyces sp. NPDC048436]|uniref:hypothetical protein n=1 Tax=Streptomyces sp. NPDC048436 TaxID=3365550 RepID=UPI0037202C24